MKIIDNYRDLTIGMYLDICEVDARTDIDDVMKQVIILSHLTGMSEDDILNLSIPEYRTLATKSHFLSHPYNGEIQMAKKYTIGKWELIPVTDFQKITAAQYIDFQTFAKEGEKRIVEIISILLVPKGKKYNQDYDIVELQNDLRKALSVADALTLFAFFFVQYKALIKDSLTYCREVAMEIADKDKRMKTLRMIQEQEDLLKSGVGLRM